MYTKVIEHSQNDVIHYVLNIPSKAILNKAKMLTHPLIDLPHSDINMT